MPINEDDKLQLLNYLREKGELESKKQEQTLFLSDKKATKKKSLAPATIKALNNSIKTIDSHIKDAISCVLSKGVKEEEVKIFLLENKVEQADIDVFIKKAEEKEDAGKTDTQYDWEENIAENLDFIRPSSTVINTTETQELAKTKSPSMEQEPSAPITGVAEWARSLSVSGKITKEVIARQQQEIAQIRQNNDAEYTPGKTYEQDRKKFMQWIHPESKGFDDRGIIYELGKNNEILSVIYGKAASAYVILDPKPDSNVGASVFEISPEKDPEQYGDKNNNIKVNKAEQSVVEKLGPRRSIGHTSFPFFSQSKNIANQAISRSS